MRTVWEENLTTWAMVGPSCLIRVASATADLRRSICPFLSLLASRLRCALIADSSRLPVQEQTTRSEHNNVNVMSPCKIYIDLYDLL